MTYLSNLSNLSEEIQKTEVLSYLTLLINEYISGKSVPEELKEFTSLFELYKISNNEKEKEKIFLSLYDIFLSISEKSEEIA